MKTKNPLLNLDQLNRIGNNDAAFTIKMLQKFSQAVLECSETMISAQSDGDWNKIKSAAHKNIPSFTLMGLNDVANDLKYLENHKRLPELDSAIEDLVKKIVAKNAEIIDEIKDYLEELKPA